jgi:hypothetical protein
MPAYGTKSRRWSGSSTRSNQVQLAFEAFRDGYVRTGRHAGGSCAAGSMTRATSSPTSPMNFAIRVTCRHDLPSSEPALMDALLDLADPPNEPAMEFDEDQEENWHLLSVLYTVVERYTSAPERRDLRLEQTGRRATSASRSVYALDVQRQRPARRHRAADGEQQ